MKRRLPITTTASILSAKTLACVFHHLSAIRWLFVFCGLLASGWVQAQTQTAKTLASSSAPGGQIGYLEYKPAGYSPTDSVLHPLIIFFHGLGGEGNGTTEINKVATSAAGSIAWYCADTARGNRMTFTVNGRTSSFVVLSPQLSSSYSPDLFWRDFYISDMIAYAKANLKIDPNRIYVTGLSMGGRAAWNAGKDPIIRASVAAIAPVASVNGFYTPGPNPDTDPTDFCNTIAANHVPFWAFTTVNDGYSYWPTSHARDFATACSMTPTPKFTFYRDAPNGDPHSTTWINAYDPANKTFILEGGSSFTANPNLYEWFLSKNLGGNTPPTVSAGANKTIVLPTSSTTLTGTAAGTNGASITSTVWTKVSGPAGGTIASPNALTTSISSLAQGVYVFRLTATDNHSLTATSDVTVTVNAAGNQAPVSIAGSNVTIVLPTSSVTLDGTASYDPDGTIVAYYWEQLSGPSATIANNTASVTTASGLVQGTYTFRLHVRDNSNVVSLSAAKTVTVNAAAGSNQAPVSVAGANVTITLPTSSVTLDGTASYDPDGTIVAYYWEQLSGPTPSATIANNTAASTTASNLTQGTYVFRLHVRDNGNIVSLSTKQVTVNAASNQPPVSIAGSNVTITLPTSTVTLDGSASYDPDGTIVAYYWEQLSGPTPTATIANNTAVTTTASGLVQGTYVFRLHVRDNGNIVTLSSKTVTVNPNGSRMAESQVITGADERLTSTTLHPVLSLYPNPGRSYANIELHSLDNNATTIKLYNTTGKLVASYTWQLTKGKNTYYMKNIPGLGKGLYLVDISDVKGNRLGTVKFLKL